MSMAIPSRTDQALPAMTWEQLELVLQDEAGSPLQALMAHHLIEGLREQSRFLTLGGVLREIAVVTLAVTDRLNGETSMSSSS
jgi:hypothetical protein